jgi:hypothetical protein
VKPSGFRPAEVAALEAWAAARWFDLDWVPGLTQPVTTFNELDDPALFHAARAALAGPDAARRFAARYPFRVAPATDRRPYPHHFLRPRAVADLLRRGPGEWLPVAEWGYLTLLATLAQAGVLGALALLLPTALRAGRPVGPGSSRLLVYFGAIGLAYLAAELAAIQQLTLLLGHPVYAVSAVLALLLVSSGVGSVLSDRLRPAWGIRAVSLVAGLLGVAAVGLLPLVHGLDDAPTGLRIAGAALALVPLGVLMGLPFPLGLRALARENAARVSWAWAANSFASVVAAPLAALVALEVGSPMLFAVGAAGYLLAAAALRGWSPNASPG